MAYPQLKYLRRLLRVDDKLYLVITFMLLLSFHSGLGEPCKFDLDHPCICKTQNFQLNLESFMKARGGADLQATGENDQYIYYVQPCNRKLSTQLQSCITVNPDLVSCQVDANTKQQAYGLGVLHKYEVTRDQDNFILTNSFIQQSDMINRTLHLTVKCSDQDGEFTYQGSNKPPSPVIYKFTLATRHICAGAKNEGGLSPGSVMVIIFFVLLIVYILGGLLFQKFIRKAQGVEIIPNYVFWKDFPFLVKDGFVFTFQCCKGSSGYDKI
ncbi:unnamed protein product [Candidula unifasciata]|uniref:Cation-dependent mannose-6-phosphate receptor n=1 Tax=Candidula unifasciata TaxID=100452 RepID=A0A8S3Z6F5_9EUPU|nr:unnamed protein product [Candidula unifasciata]